MKSFFQCLTFLTEYAYCFAELYPSHSLSFTIQSSINVLSVHSLPVDRHHSFATDSEENLFYAHSLSKIKSINASNSPSFVGKVASMTAV